jgi:predicted nucleic acid-binding protein
MSSRTVRSLRRSWHAPKRQTYCGAFEIAKQITKLEASAAHEDLMQLELELFAFDLFAERIWELRHNVTSYDAWYVAVAEALKLPLATLDERLSRAKGPTCKFLTPGVT